MKALVDADVLRYEVGFASETGWKSITQSDDVPPWDYVEGLLTQRLASIVTITQSDKYQLYLSKGPSFRNDIAKTRVYKGTRRDHKPWHYTNLTSYMTGCLNAKTVEKLEADDSIGIDHCRDPDTIVCSRDKDFRQLPGWLYSWELGKQASYGPLNIDRIGTLELSPDRKSIKGNGFYFFCSQLLTGDTVDNIPGCGGYGPVKAFTVLQESLSEPSKSDRLLLSYVEAEYKKTYPDNWKEILIEQGDLLWIVRDLYTDGSPILFSDIYYG